MAPKRKRGPIMNEKVRKGAVPQREITFKENGTPIEPNKSKFTNIVSHLVRDRVSCTIKSWDKVDSKLKNWLWDEVKNFWNLKDDTFKILVTKYMGERWKAWKTRLKRDFIKNADPENPMNPWDYGNHIEAEEWEQFKAYVESEDFKKKSAKVKENAQKNIHPHRHGSGGYETTMSKWKATDVLSTGSSSSVINRQTDSRSFIWLMARAIPSEEEGVFTIPNPATIDVVKRVESLSQQVSQGSFHPVRHNDVLTASLGTPEHPGRVRGYSGGFTIKGVFGPGSRRTSHAECVRASKVARIVQEALRAQSQEFHQQMAEILQQANIVVPPANGSPNQSRPPSPTQVSSNFTGPVLIQEVQVGDLPKDPIPCTLFFVLEENHKVMVAHGNIVPTLGNSVHHDALQAGLYT